MARQVLAKPSVQAVLWLVCCLSMASRDCASVHWHTGCQEAFRLRAREGGRCRRGSRALAVGQLPVISTPWVANSEVWSRPEAPSSSLPPSSSPKRHDGCAGLQSFGVAQAGQDNGAGRWGTLRETRAVLEFCWHLAQSGAQETELAIRGSSDVQANEES